MDTIRVKFPSGEEMNVRKDFIETSEFYKGLVEVFEDGIPETLELGGEINKEIAEKFVRQLLMLEAAGDDPVKVFIDSPGGDADTGYAIFDMIRFIKPDVYTIGMGLVAPCRVLILLGTTNYI